MNTIKLIFKSLAIFAAAWTAFGFVIVNPMILILVTAAAVTVMTYLFGDLLIFPVYGNIVSSFGDGVMGIFTAYLIDLLSTDFTTNIISLAAFGGFITLFEFFYHIYLRRVDKVI